MATVKVLLRKTHVNKDNKTPVFVRISHNGKSKFISTKILIANGKDWDKSKSRVKSGFPNSSRVNYNLSSLEHGAQDIALKLDNRDLVWSQVNLKTLIYDTKEEGFIEFGRKMGQRYNDAGSYRTSQRYKTILNKLQAYLKGKDIGFSEITVEFLTDYQNHLVKIGNKVNTIHTNLKTIRAILYEAFKHGKLEQSKNPFFQFKLKKERAQIAKPTAGEIELIKQFNAEIGTWLEKTKDAFMFSFYCAGIRVGDLLQLKGSSILPDNTLCYTMDKTKDPRIVKLTKPALEILKKYKCSKADPIFPFLTKEEINGDRKTLLRRISSVNAQLNLNLKKLTKLAGITTNYKFHMSRHGFSELARKKNISTYDISKALGHKSISVTEQYLKSFDLDSHADTMSKMFE